MSSSLTFENFLPDEAQSLTYNALHLQVEIQLCIYKYIYIYMHIYIYTLQHTAAHCNTLQHTATHLDAPALSSERLAREFLKSQLYT